MAGKAVAIDPGSHTRKVLSIKMGKGGISVLRFAAVAAAEGAEGLAATGIPLAGAVAGLAGRDMTLRYTQVPPSPDWQLENLMDLEIHDLSSQSGGSLSADYNLLPIEDEEGGMDTVLMALARNDALERVAALVKEAGGSVAGHIPNCIALYNAFLRGGPVEEDAVVCLANIGNETIDIALVRGADLLFARNLSGGGKVLDDAIASAFNVSARKAESLKRDLLDLDPASRGRYASGQAEKVTMAAGGAASMIVSAIQSSVAFCQSQTKVKDLRVDKVLLCGGSARVRGLRGMLREALRCPVELFDPFESCDLSALPEADAQALRQQRSEAVVALGLAATKVDETLYSVEILPEAVKRRKRFMERTVWNVLAAGVAAVVLLLTATVTSAERDDLEVKARTLSLSKRRLLATHDEAAKLAEDILAKRQMVEFLAEKSVPLDGTLRTLRALDATLLPDLWIKSLEVLFKAPQGQGERREARHLIELKGQGKEVSGRPLEQVYSNFSTAFRQHPLIAVGAITPVSPAATAGSISFKFEIDFRPPESPTKNENPQKK